MLTVNKMYDDFVAHNNKNNTNNNNKTMHMHSNIPERLRKHNSIDMSAVKTGMTTDTIETSNDVICDEETKNTPIDNFNSEFIEQEIIHTTIDKKLVDVVTMGTTEQSGARSDVSSTSDYTSRKSSGIAEIIITEHFDDFSVYETRDENNNNNETKTNNGSSSDVEVISQNHIDENIDHITEQSEATPKDDELQDNLVVATLVEYDRSDISSDSEGDENKNSRRISITRSRRNRNLNAARRSRSSVENENLMEEQDQKSDDMNTSVASSCGSPGSRRRRVGVSAEPVRVSWSTLRESYKQEQMNSFSKPEGEINCIG